MRLSNLLTPNEGLVLSGQDHQVSGISSDSRQITAGSLFVAIPGTKQNGADFIKDAIDHGAIAAIVDSELDTSALPSSFTIVKTPNVRHTLSAVASRFYPRQPQTIAAVTGTSGKTSTVQFTRELWETAGHQAASLGTLGLISPQKKLYGSLTTPDPVTLYRTIDDITAQGVSHLALEASSHGIELHRLDHVRVTLGAFTNLSRDHLDYHETMERYLAAKLRLFTTLLKPNGTAILNADIPEYEELKALCDARRLRTIDFGHKGHDLSLISQTPTTDGQQLCFEVFGKRYEILLPIIGQFQVWNSLCALCLTIGSGENPEKMVAAMEKLSGVPGRLELIGTTASKATVFVDYAHKPAALEHVLTALRPHIENHQGAKLHVIFGCGGNRDKGKRPQMGAIAQRLADNVIVTDDNPRGEEARIIRQEILEGCQKGPNLREIGDRAMAIAQGIQALGPNDILVIAGKGHEEGQIVGDKVLPFNDADEARKVLGQL